MKFFIITILPEAFNSYLKASILKRAGEKGLIKINLINLRDYASGKHKKVDDAAYGGGPGMVLMAEPILKAIAKNKKLKTKIIIFDAAGKQFNDKMAQELSKEKELMIVCGRYEGIDERIVKILKTQNRKLKIISVGPYVLTGGELPAMLLIDAVSRKIPGVLGKQESLEEKRYGAGVPVYTRPEVFAHKGKRYKAPKVLLSGNHKKIEEWRKAHRKIKMYFFDGI